MNIPTKAQMVALLAKAQNTATGIITSISIYAIAAVFVAGWLGGGAFLSFTGLAVLPVASFMLLFGALGIYLFGNVLDHFAAWIELIFGKLMVKVMSS